MDFNYSLAEEAGRLAALLHDAQRDAERYRWLRARPLDDDGEIYIAAPHNHQSRWGLGGDDPDGCDAEIDTAMAAEREGQG
ncbi:hypothetical protein NG831_06450 [Xanthomonas sacchari]|uniref:hypothetical protein n=1 Tax=Xanthomonas sacchari TaxID=56458 RepID=UPI00224E7C28|nr:hypothetical protein [Xanthomonas sacchari]UYK67800.1 hypothetical protein NG831_06450 [Xanthomonas sacchari]